MKHNRLMLIVLVLASALLLQIICQQQLDAAEENKTTFAAPKPPLEPGKAQVPDTKPDKSPKIRFEELRHDFGKVNPRASKTCEFNFKNLGEGVLKIEKIQSTCGCTVPKLKKKEYNHGESGSIEVQYRAGNHAGKTRKRLFVYSNDKESKKVTLTVMAEIVKKVDYEPKRLNLLLKKNNAGCGQITIFSLDNQPFAIKRFDAIAGAISADINPSVEKTRFVLEPKIDVEKLEENLNGRISIGLTHPECDTITIPFSTLPEFKVNPASIILFNVKPQKPVKRQLWILNNYNEHFEVESVSVETDTIKVVSQEMVDKRYKFVLEIMPPTPKGKQRVFTDAFCVNIKGGKTLEVLCRGFYSID